MGSIPGGTEELVMRFTIKKGWFSQRTVIDIDTITLSGLWSTLLRLNSLPATLLVVVDVCLTVEHFIPFGALIAHERRFLCKVLAARESVAYYVSILYLKTKVVTSLSAQT